MISFLLGKVFHQPDYENNTAEPDLLEVPESPVCNEITVFPLIVSVTPSTEFHDTRDRNSHLEFYHTRSKKRGRVLILNNYEFADADPKHRFRNGADKDNENLVNLFRQMGGWEIEHHNNLPAEVSIVRQRKTKLL